MNECLALILLRVHSYLSLHFPYFLVSCFFFVMFFFLNSQSLLKRKEDIFCIDCSFVIVGMKGNFFCFNCLMSE